MGLGHGSEIAIGDIALYIDSANLRCYPGTGVTATDLSSYNNVGSLTSITQSGAGATSGLLFNGSSSVIGLGTGNGLNISTAWTVEAWINPKSFGELDSGRIFQNSSGSLTGFIFSLDNSQTTAGLQLNTYAVAGFSVRFGNCINLEQWQQVAISLNSGTATFYVNGASIGSSSITSPSAYTGNKYIGNTSTASNTFDGRIGILRVYRYVLSSTQILQNYNATKGRYGLV